MGELCLIRYFYFLFGGGGVKKFCSVTKKKYSARGEEVSMGKKLSSVQINQNLVSVCEAETHL